MDLQQRLVLLSELGDYMSSDSESWQSVKQQASAANAWFTPEFIELQTRSIATSFLNADKLKEWAESYAVPVQQRHPKDVGIIMAGNLPLVGFHDFLSVFVSGHRQTVKLSSRDQVLFPHILNFLVEKNPRVKQAVSVATILKSKDAYIATGSNNSSRYFEYYFEKYPHIIRRNRTSVAILNGQESFEELEKLADDVYSFFGLGCRNVTKLYVPQEYDFVPLLEAFRKYNYLFDHNKYKNNYDYQLAILIINSRYYMTNGSVILLEEPSVFSPISQLNFAYYQNLEALKKELENNDQLQCIVGNGYIPFGTAQKPKLTDYADKVDTMKFLLSL